MHLGKAFWTSGIWVVFVGVKWGASEEGGEDVISRAHVGMKAICVFRAHGEKLLVSLVPKVKVGKRTG